MKKFFKGLTISFLSFAFLFFAGCGTTNSSLSYTLDYNLDKLMSAVENNEDVDNEDIVISKMYSLENNSLNNTKSLSNKITENDSINNDSIFYNNDKNFVNPPFVIPELDKQIVTSEEIPNKEFTSKKNKLNNLNKYSKTSFNTINEEKNLKNSLTLRPSKINQESTNRYIPRYSSSQNSNKNYTNYLNKIEDVYFMMDDAVNLNNEIKSRKENILNLCKGLKIISKQLKANEINLTDEQIKNCNNLLKELGKITNKLIDTRNDVKNISKNLNSYKALEIELDSINVKYITLINCLDNKLSNYENALIILNELQKILTQSKENVDEKVLNNLKEIVNNQTKCLKDQDGNCYYEDENGQYYKLNENGEKDYISDNKLKELKDFNKNTIYNDYDNNIKNDTNYNNDINLNNEKNETKVNEKNNKQNENNDNNYENKSNIDTYKNQTVTPNIVKSNLNKKQNNNFNNNSENNKQIMNNQNANNSFTYNSNSINNPIAQENQNMNYGIPNFGNGIAPNVGNGVVPNVGNGVVPGLRNGVGIHNFENGTINPYRNTDTYKLPPFNSIVATNSNDSNQIDLLKKPLPNERRQDFKTFSTLNPSLKNISESEEKNNQENLKRNDTINENQNGNKKTEIKTKTLTKYNEANKNPIIEQNNKTA